MGFDTIEASDGSWCALAGLLQRHPILESGTIMIRWLARLRYAWQRHGPLGFVWLAVRNLEYCTFGRIRSVNITPPSDSFDQEYGTDTDGTRDIGSLDVIESVAARYAVRYEPSSPQLVRAELEKLNIDFRRFTFVDFGSGKGRVFLVAASFPFKEVVGVEFSPEFHEIALENIARLSASAARAGGILSIQDDARAARAAEIRSSLLFL